jgi:hypothetical protein
MPEPQARDDAVPSIDNTVIAKTAAYRELARENAELRRRVQSQDHALAIMAKVLRPYLTAR